MLITRAVLKTVTSTQRSTLLPEARDLTFMQVVLRHTVRLTFQNYGAITLNSVLFTITDDANNELGSYQWEGNLAQNATDEILFDEIDFADAAYGI